MMQTQTISEQQHRKPADAMHKGQQQPFFAPTFIQPKLTVNQPSDAYEQEADAVAEKVMRMPASDAQPLFFSPKPIAVSQVQQKCEQCKGEEKKEEEDEAQPVQLKPEKTFDIQRKCAQCEEEEKGVQRKETGGIDSAGMTAPSIVHDVISSRGQPLDKSTRNFMESRFGYEFGDVQIHNDALAHRSSADINALAYTHGNHVVFGNGHYQPHTNSGKQLLAHELAHVVQQQKGVSRKEGNKNKPQKTDKEKTPILKALPDQLADFSKNNPYLPKEFKGFIKKIVDVVEIHLVDFDAKEYLVKSDISWLPKSMKLPLGERKTNQLQLWKDKVKPGIKDQLKKLSGTKEENKTFILSLQPKKAKSNKTKIKKGIAGSLSQLAEEVSVPFWDVSGKERLFDVEHLVDWQIAGDNADNERNLILLDRTLNRSMGNKIRNKIYKHLEAIIKHYHTEFSGFANDGKKDLVRFNNKKHSVFIDNIIPRKTDLDDDQWYFKEEMIDAKYAGHPFTNMLIDVSDSKIPDGYFVLRTTDDRAGYLLPKNATNERIGAWEVSVVYDNKADELKSVLFQIVVRDENDVIKNIRRKRIATGKNLKPIEQENQDDNEEEIKAEKKENHIYEVQSEKLRKKFGRAFKELYGEVNLMSPIVLNEPSISGFDVAASGKVTPTLSFLKDVDIDFGIANGDFFIQATVPLDQIAKNFPKPFEINTCSLVISASSSEGLTVEGIVGFKLGSFGEGELIAGKDKNGLFFNGAFNFNNKWFKPATVDICYNHGNWCGGGKIGIPDKMIPGVKSAELEIGYAGGTISAKGSAELTVPGLSKIDLAAQFDDKGNFALAADATLGKLPGIKGGNVKVIIKSAQGENILLYIEGKAIPDLPNIPQLQTEFSFLYDNGIFDINAEVQYKKGRFTGKLQLGITNRSVDENGQPSGESNDTNPVVVYGFGELTAVLFNDSKDKSKEIKGTVKVRLSPAGDLLVAGEILLRDLKPFGDGYNFEKPLVPFPTISIPLVGIPGMSVSAFVGGGVFFSFNWQPLILKQLKINLLEININELDTAQIDIAGTIGSSAKAEVYLVITAGLKAQVLIAKLKGELSGQAGLGIEAEAGGALSATWNANKGLQFKEVRAFLNITPKAIFKLTGSVSVDLDLWVTEINLYYHKWVFAEKSIDLGGLTLKLDFPIRFAEDNSLIMPDLSEMNLQRPDFSGDQGLEIIDSAINGDAKKELEAKKQQIREQIRQDLRSATNDEDFTPSKYTQKMMAKYKKSPELQKFVLTTIEEESRNLEYEQFEKQKNIIRNLNVPLQNKLVLLKYFTMFRSYIADEDIENFRMELIKTEEFKKMMAQQLAQLAELNKKIAAEAEAQKTEPVVKTGKGKAGIRQKSKSKSGAG